ncbi:MAG: TonB-dependent receptor plug domain-containing protein [Gammaproteobacteria bacterium]|nr:TonB-dependent receptor plug domain-containing protein [Gammaproteobacteria bacterium]
MDPRHAHPTALRNAALSLFGLLIATSVGAADADTTDVGDEQEDSATEEEVIEVPVLVEAAEIEVQPGHVQYDAEFIAALPGGDSNLADLLRVNPAVDFARESDLSMNSAVQRPAEISIHGQPFYQNAFLIDGIDTANDLNPANAGDIWSTPSLVQPHGGSSPQSYYIDTNLIESIKVYDSNVPAEYGGFLGGVVAAELKRYDGVDSASIGYRLQRDEWEEFHVTEDDLTAADYYRAAYTPDYRRSYLRLGAQRGFGDLGLGLSVSRRHSTFAQSFVKRYHFARLEDQHLEYEDVIDNILGRVDTNLGETAVGISFRHSKRRHDGLTSTTYDGRFKKDHDGSGLTLDIEREIGADKLEMSIGFDRVRDILDSDTNTFSFREYAEGSATESQYEGAFGDSRQSQTRISVVPKLTMATRKGGRFQHNIVLGAQLGYTDSYYERPADVVFEQYWCIRDQGREGCRDQNGDGVSGPEDEYRARISNWFAGKVDVTYGSAGLHAEDVIQVGRWQLSLGMRIDWDDYLGNVDVSPRISAQRDLFGDDRTTLIAGVNRYYGRSFFRYALNDAISGWRDSTQFNSDGSVRRVTNFDDRSGRSDLSTPYSDEWMLGWTQALGKVTARLQFVNREGRDGVSRARFCLDPADSRCREYDYIYTNDGRSSTQSVGLGLTSAVPIAVGPTETTVTLGLGYKDSTNNRQDDDGYDEQINADLIYYGGQLTTVEDLPAWDYNVPFSTGLVVRTIVPRWNVVWTNFLRLSRGGTIARDSGLDCDDDEVNYCEGSYDIYEDHDFDGLMTVDARIEWGPEFMAGAGGYVRLEVKNLFDDTIDTNSSRLSDRRRITSGRLFWMEVGLDLPLP